MSMLAEPKRKQRWSLNPRGKYWSEDSNKYGQKLLEKMGWKNGKGLGANEDGITENIKLSYKNDSKGMGYKEKEQWTEHDANFSQLLESLSNSTETPKHDFKSLELKSQTSKVRVHYHKFTRGKDLTRYSEKDLANIFGRTTLKKERKKEIIPDYINKEIVPEKPNSNFLESGCMTDYFKKKLPNFGYTAGYVVGNNGVLTKEDSDDEQRSFGFGFRQIEPDYFENETQVNEDIKSEKGVKRKNKHKKNKKQDVEDNEISMKKQCDKSECVTADLKHVEKRQKRKKQIEEFEQSELTNVLNAQNVIENDANEQGVQCNDEQVGKLKKKRKKNRKMETNENVEETSTKEKSKKKKLTKMCD